MTPLSLLPGAATGGGPLVESVLAAMSPQGGAAVQQVAPAEGAPKQPPMTGPGSTARKYGGPGGDIWASVLQALVPTAGGMRLPYSVLDPAKREDHFTGLGVRTLAKGPKGGLK